MNESNKSVEELLANKGAKEQILQLKFEEGTKLLENLVAIVESGNLSLDKAVDAYELASTLVKHLRCLLGEAEGKLKVLQENSLE